MAFGARVQLGDVGLVRLSPWGGKRRGLVERGLVDAEAVPLSVLSRSVLARLCPSWKCQPNLAPL
jgi:hypothetical protein